MLTTTLLVLLLFSGITQTTSSSHVHKRHKKHDVTNKESGHKDQLKSPVSAVNADNSTRRSIWDAINNANISVENHVHSYTAKSDISKETNSTRRNIWDAINNANISVENHVHSYTAKSEINKSQDVNSTRRDVWDLIRNANMSVHNSVHSTAVLKSALRPKKVIEVTGQKRDEEPSHPMVDDGPAPVSVRGKSPSDVAE